MVNSYESFIDFMRVELGMMSEDWMDYEVEAEIERVCFDRAEDEVGELEEDEALDDRAQAHYQNFLDMWGDSLLDNVLRRCK